jgi:glucosamine--fructose-6-phosphate aminotransferase (isomerizing)
MATSSLLGRRIFLAAAQRSTYYQQQAFFQSSAAVAASTTSSHYSYRNNSSASASSRFGLLGGATALALAVAANNDTNKTSKCCGIAGVVGARGDARDYLIEGLTILKNRGYDSAGIATMDDANPELVVSLDLYFFCTIYVFVDRPCLYCTQLLLSVISCTFVSSFETHRSLSLPATTCTLLSSQVTKYASEGEKADGLNLVAEKSSASNGHNIGIAHTRWATHGGKTDANAHPHTDSSGKIALVHNGTLNNANELRRELQSRGHKFSSETDTEVIAKLIGEYYEKQEEGNKSVKMATEQALARCDGSWGLCIMCTDCPDQLVVARNGSPLVIGIGSDRTFIASETSAFNRYTKNFISMNDGEIGILRADGSTLDLTRMQVAPDQEVKLSPAPYPHWTLKECVEQPEAIARALGFGGRLTSDHVQLGGLEKMKDELSRVKYLTMSACGTSLNAAKYAEKLMKHLGSFDMVHSLDAAETDANDFPKNSEKAKESAFLVVSQSGETKDVANVVNAAQAKDLTVMSVVNAVGSLIARTTKLGVYCNAGRENAVASTKAFTTQVTVLALIALWFRELKDKVNGITEHSAEAALLKESLMRLPICCGMALKNREQCQQVAERLNGKDHCFILGKGYGEPVAMEGALKIKEMCYLHAEGYSGGALKHGPFALIESNENGKQGATPIIMLILDDNHAHHMRTAAEEVKARGADVIVITDKAELADGIDSKPILIPSNGPMTALGAVMPIQLIAYELAMLRGINPDTPRNLAKAVTVD